ncbi:MAG: glycoside hydrolase family 88 protein [Muribaculaceae bacterium]|nr:glycoside hydrolase family 88 protein [Muribaculaceae bacterium]
MKKFILCCFGSGVMLLMSQCASKQPVEDNSWLKNAIDTSVGQLEFTLNEIGDSALLPRSIWTDYDMDFLCSQLERDPATFKDSLRVKPVTEALGTRRYCSSIYDWTSGFFPGNLWYAYELTGKDNLKNSAVTFTNYLYPLKDYTGTHDIGFMMNCSYGNAYRQAPADSVRIALIQTADNLCGRFDDGIGCIRSWDFGTWNFPVIIDNMMNLDLLFYVSHLTGDDKYKDLALTHAKVTKSNHFRDDYTSYHVVSYNNDGSVETKCTHQGKNDDSAWARGQAWGVYGYTSCFRESGDTLFLNQAKDIADMIITRVTTADGVPLWDYDAPDTSETPRDASAAAITASALLELSTLTDDGQVYFDYAEKLLKSLSSDAYLANVGDNQGFILKHSVGSLPNGSEIDTPINYADYYYLEALNRYMQIKGLEYNNL